MLVVYTEKYILSYTKHVFPITVIKTINWTFISTVNVLALSLTSKRESALKCLLNVYLCSSDKDGDNEDPVSLRFYYLIMYYVYRKFGDYK